MGQNKPKIWVILESVLRKLKSDISQKSHLPNLRNSKAIPSACYLLSTFPSGSSKLSTREGNRRGRFISIIFLRTDSLLLTPFESEFSGKWEKWAWFKNLSANSEIWFAPAGGHSFESLYIHAQTLRCKSEVISGSQSPNPMQKSHDFYQLPCLFI